jgi:transposase IS116/IS110/IS902 family protein
VPAAPDRIALSVAAVAGSEAKIAVKAAPYQHERELLSIDGFGDAVAQAWLAETGPAPLEYFASHEKLASWVTLCPLGIARRDARLDIG